MRRLLLLSAVAVAAITAAPALSRPMFSSQERVQGLLEGKGMGLAVPAENHGYPGPRHVLDAADMLALTPEQKAKTAALVEQMKAEAIPASERLLADEAALDQLFIDRRADLASITAASRQAALSESAVQVVHLKYHLAMRDILTPAQITMYASMGSHPEQGRAPTAQPDHDPQAHEAGHVHGG
jgi:Spy/CpxP family protein refolding chaperone